MARNKVQPYTPEEQEAFTLGRELVKRGMQDDIPKEVLFDIMRLNSLLTQVSAAARHERTVNYKTPLQKFFRK